MRVLKVGRETFYAAADEAQFPAFKAEVPKSIGKRGNDIFVLSIIEEHRRI